MPQTSPMSWVSLSLLPLILMKTLSSTNLIESLNKNCYQKSTNKSYKWPW